MNHISSSLLHSHAPKAFSEPQGDQEPSYRPASQCLIMFFGAPGSGKGTQSRKLAKAFKVPVISIGDRMKHEVKIASSLGQEAADYMNRGEMVPLDVVLRILTKGLEEYTKEHIIILDGFPRNVSQAQALDKKIVTDLVGTRLVGVALHTPLDIVAKRLAKRLTCFECGFTGTHIITHCLDCGASLEQRLDDSVELITKRLAYYQATEQALLDFYTPMNADEKNPYAPQQDSDAAPLEQVKTSQHAVMHHINGDQNEELVYADITQALSPFLPLSMHVKN